MRPIAEEFPSSQGFASMPTAGVVGNINAGTDTAEYWVGRFGNYQPFGHAGWDGKCPVGTPIHAMAGGVVLFADWGYNLPGQGPVRKWLFYSTFPGKLTVIQHPWGIGAYAHQSEFRVKAGDVVTEGQVIGLSGNTGGVDPHVHVEALVDLSYRTGGGLIYGRTDPTKYFGTIAPAGEIEEDPFMGWSDDEKRRMLAAADRVNGRMDDVRVLNAKDGAYMNNVRDAQYARIMAALDQNLDKEDGGYIVKMIEAAQPDTMDPEALADAFAALVPDAIAEATLAALGRKLEVTK